jgi:hypothetical protein
MAEQKSQSMTSEGDFTLYPYPDAWKQDQSYTPTTTYAEQSYLSIPAFEPYNAQQDHRPIQDQFHFGVNPAFNRSRTHLQPVGGNYSPSHSVAHSFDYQYPAHISSVSDSGASVQSTISSAMASPSMQHQNDWNHQDYPSIVQHDSMYPQSFNNSGVELNAAEKGCVGESTNNSSSQRPNTARSFPASVDLLAMPLPSVQCRSRSSPRLHFLSSTYIFSQEPGQD